MKGLLKKNGQMIEIRDWCSFKVVAFPTQTYACLLRTQSIEFKEAWDPILCTSTQG